MTNINADRDTLRALADEGNEMALDRLADLADQRPASRSQLGGRICNVLHE
jgi:hypothetical protein